MSETDSDLDFESADEETESESRSKCNPEKTESTNHSVNQFNDTKAKTSISSEAEEKISESTKKSVKVPDQESDEYEQKKESLTKPGEGNDTDFQQDKHRVTLRLEKKLQQKNQIPKENSVQKLLNMNSADSKVENEVKSSSWGFGSWGTNLFSTAASSVSTFTNQVSQGIGTVIETVENTLGAPPPEKLATALNKKNELPDGCEDGKTSPSNENKESNVIAEDEKSTESRSGLLPDVSSWTKVLENTGSKVIMGGLDTLELIGKKTIDILTEGDPGLRKKRAVFSDGLTLSQILREAKTEADEQDENNSEGKDAIHYSQLFDEFQGLVHLEALEMLSKQSQAKVQRFLSRLPRDSEIKKSLDEIKTICESIPSLDDPSDCEKFEDFEAVFKKHVLELNLPFNPDSVVKTQTRIDGVIRKYEESVENPTTPEEIYQSAICSLAEFTAKCIETFHKLAELILVQPTLDPNAEQCATNLTGLTTVMCVEINNLSTRYHSCLDSLPTQSKGDADAVVSNVTIIVTNLYVEAANSNKYIQDAYQLLVPVLQVSLLEVSD